MGMSLYEIDRRIEEWEPVLDEGTGEVLNFSELDELRMVRDEKIENIALYIKNLDAEAEAIRTEEKALAERRRAAEGKAERLKAYLQRSLEGAKFSTPRVAVSYRKTSAVDLAIGFASWATAHAPQLLRYKEPEPDKAAVKKYLEGNECPYAKITERQSIQIK